MALAARRKVTVNPCMVGLVSQVDSVQTQPMGLL
jgi:hypothetical protein